MSGETRVRSVPVEWVRGLLGGSATGIVVATVLLFAVSPVIAPGSLGSAPMLSMLPFASVLAVVAIGQTLVVQQRGLDLSVPGMIALAAVLSTGLVQMHGWPLWAAVVAGILCGTVRCSHTLPRPGSVGPGPLVSEPSSVHALSSDAYAARRRP